MDAIFFSEKEIYREQDELGEIVVTQCDNKRSMSFASALQQSSLLVDKLHYLIHEYTQIMLLGTVLAQPKHITLLGLGGGGLVHCLNYYLPEVSLQVVELRQSVIDIAYEFFYLPRENNIQVSCNDAFLYMNKVTNIKTDLILSDLYEADGMSECQQQVKFIDACFERLSHQGWLVINFHSLPESNSSVMLRIHAVFSAVMVCDVFKGNWVVFCGVEKIETDRIKLENKIKVLSKQMDLPLFYYYKQMRAL